MPVFYTASETETAELAARIAAAARPGAVYLLEGAMGAGKSVFARGFIRALAGNSTEVPSPTFTLVQTYDTPKGMIWHFDLYRLKDAEEIYEIGWEDAMAGGISIIEWPQRLGPLSPAGGRTIEISIEPDKTRKVILSDD